MATEIANLKQGTTEWLEYRKAHITATDIAPIMGVSPWDSTSYTLFFDKTSTEVPTPKDNKYLEWGARLEPVVIDKLAEELHITDIKRGKCYENGWMMASLDAEGEWNGNDLPFSEHVIIEAKTTSHKDGWWDEDGNETIPMHYQLQAIWQMIVTGYRKVIFTCLCFGSDWWYRIMEWDEQMANDVLANADYFHGCVGVGRIPAFVPQKYSQAAEAERKLRMQKMAEETTRCEVAMDVVEEYRLAKELAEDANVRLSNAQCSLLEQLGTNKIGYIIDAEDESEREVVKVVKAGRGFAIKLIK